MSGEHRCAESRSAPRTPRSALAHAPTATVDPREARFAAPAVIVPAQIARSFADRYRIDEELGRGGWATVYRARDLADGANVALKVLSPELRADASHVRRFLAEARTLAQVHHPHVVMVRDCGKAGAFVYLALELLAGRSLAGEISRHAPFAPARATRLAVQICDGLGAAHDRGIVHRDLKPENVLLLDRGGGDFAKVADFGIACSLVDEGDEGTWWLACTPRYASPEQARGDAADARSDLFALGLVLFEMLSGRPPFPVEDTLPTLRRRSTTPAPDLHRAHPELALPAGLDEALGRLLALDPADRPRNCAEARALLAPFCGESVTLSRAADLAETADMPAVFAPLDLSPPLRGRDEELADLLPFAERLDDHPRAAVVVVAGAPGAGKSRLCGAIADAAVARHGARRYERECSGNGAAPEELASLIEEVLGTRRLDAAVLTRRLGDLLADRQGAAELTAVLRPTPDGERPAHDSEAQRNYRCQLVLEALGRIASQRPLVVLLEEAQRADGLTRAVIGRLPLWARDRGRGLLLLATWTTGTGVEPPAALQRERFAERARLVRLGPLDREGSDALLRAVGPLDAAARDRIAELAGGNPLHLVQLVRHFRAEKLLVPSRRGWLLAAQARFDASVPGVIGELHAAEVARLRARGADGADAADLLERLALAGDRTPLVRLRAMLEREGRTDLLLRLEAWIAMLTSEGLVFRDGDSVVFAHALAREAIAASAGARPEAAAIHRAIAEAMLASGAENDVPGARAAARHLWQGGDAERALPLVLRAAAASRALGDGPRASEDYMLALRILESHRTRDESLRLQVELGLGEALLLGGETRQAEEHFARALHIADGAAVREGLGRVAELKGEYVVARDHLLRAEQLHAAAGRDREAAEVSLAVGRTMQKLGDLDGARERFEHARSMLERLGDAVGAARARMWLGSLGAWTGDFAAGLALLKRALPVLETTGNPLLIGECLNHMGTLSAEMGRQRDAVDLNRRAQSCFERAGMLRGLANVLGAIGTARGFLGEIDEAHQLLEASLRLSEDIEHHFQIGYCLVNLGWLCRRAGRLEESTQWLRSAVVHLQRQADPAALPYACVELGLTLLELGLLDEAEAEFRRALAAPALRPDLRKECLRRLAAINRPRKSGRVRQPRGRGAPTGASAGKRRRARGPTQGG